MTERGHAQLNQALQEEIARLQARIARLEGLRFCGVWHDDGGVSGVACFNDDCGPTQSSFSLSQGETIGRAVHELDRAWGLLPKGAA